MLFETELRSDAPVSYTLDADTLTVTVGDESTRYAIPADDGKAVDPPWPIRSCDRVDGEARVEMIRTMSARGQPVEAEQHPADTVQDVTLEWRTAAEIQDAEDQASRDRLAQQARRTLADEHDAQQQEYERDTRLGQTPQADSYTYTARDGSSHAGRDSLDMWGDDLRQIIRDAADGTLDPAEELPVPPA